MAKFNLLLILVIAAWCFVLALSPASLRAQDQALTAGMPREKGWDELRGVLAWVKSDYSSATGEKQMVLVNTSKDITVLIGEQVNNLLDKVGKEVVLTGVYKPAMMIKGKLTAVLEVRFIDQINGKSQEKWKKALKH